ncbi:hypothetical protein OEZ86_012687 [Tetradesmus obliquus]|nr:hypothetical protein OEZ86_012687 [Tetradesmus obliquus]
MPSTVQLVVFLGAAAAVGAFLACSCVVTDTGGRGLSLSAVMRQSASPSESSSSGSSSSGSSSSNSSSDLPKGWRWDAYHSHDELAGFMAWLNTTYPGVARVYSIGQSVQGRQLLAVELNGRSQLSPFYHKKPKVKLVGNIHGNEQATREMLLRLIHHIAHGYGRKHRMTQLLDNVCIHILPSMNPDGHEADTRLNTNSFDLNRNFPLDAMPYDPPSPEPSDNDSATVQSWRATGSGPLQPEVAAVMQWSKQHNFVLSASLHQGALIANYPHDACDTQGLLRSCPTQEDPLPLFLARVYAQNHALMKTNSNSSLGFVNGTVQGARWYTLLGGMQDWVFFDRGSVELTLELHEQMKPPPQQLPAMWALNQPALLRFAEMGQIGLHARLVDAEDFSPLQGTIHVTTPQHHRPLAISDPSGEFHMLLAPDVLYCLSIHAVHPYRSSQAYYAIHVAVLRLGAQWVIQGSGPKGLTDRHLFLAERVYDDGVEPAAEPQQQQQRGGNGDAGSSSSKAGSAARWKVTLYVPLQGPEDDLVAVAWSPAGCRRVLLTATLLGKLTAWTQQPPEPTSQTRITQPTLKSTFSARWDVLKLALLGGTPGDVARVVGVDLRLRIISHMMKPVFDVMREDASMRQREQRPRLTGLSPLHTYLADLMSFHIACLKTWVARRAGSSAGLPQHVPCIRHFLDWRPCNLLLLLYMITCTATSHSPTAKADDVLYPTLKQAFKAAPACKDAAWEQTARGLFPGELQLHYSETIPECLSGLTLPPEKMMAHMESSALWQRQQPLSDAEITATATRLGLLPVRPPKAAGMYRHELQLHGSFRLPLHPAADLPAAAAAAAATAAPAADALAAVQAFSAAVPAQSGIASSRLVSMKRRRWEQQLSDAMGDSLGPGDGSGSSSIVSLAQLADMDAAMPGLLLSVDGAVLAAEGPAPLAVDDGSKSVPKLIVDQCANGWMYACPITGEMWIRSAS